MSTFDPNKITFFAKTDARGQDIPFGIKAKDRQRHMYVVGKTGMGKSTLLENMAAQDIATGEGMAFIDPHGSAAETLLEYVPEHRVKDVVYFAPFDLNHPIAFNVMEDVGPDKRHLVVSGLMSTFKKIWVDAWSARMEYILTNALLALIEYPDTTLLSVNRLFVDKTYRNQVVDYIKDPAVKAFWKDEFANYTDRFAAEALPAIQNKIGQFTGNPLIRNIIGQPHSSFDIREIMDQKKILIMNLSKGLIGETNANLLGSMLTTRIYLAAMSRADLPVDVMKTMPNFYFYVDEFQSFANATFANILSEARKYHLNLIIAHQYIEQMEEDVRNAVFGNVGTTVAFRVGPFDAEVLETVFSPRFLAADLVNLGFAQIYLTLMIDGIGSQPFSAQTLPPVQRPPISCRNMVISSSRKLFANERVAVEETVAALHTPVKTESTATRRPDTRRPPATGAPRPNTPYPQSTPIRVIPRESEPASKESITKTETVTSSEPVESQKTDTTSAPATNPKPTPVRDSKPAEVKVVSVPSEVAPTRHPTPSRYRGDATKRPQPRAATSPSLDDLRAILAQVSKNDEPTKPKDTPPKESLKLVQPDSTQNQISEAIAVVSVPPPAVITSTVLTRTPLVSATPAVAEVLRPSEAPVSGLRSALAAIVQEVKTSPPVEKPTPVPTTIETRVINGSEADTSHVTQVSQASATAEVAATPSGVDVRRVKQLLRSSGREHNPFA